MKKSGLSRCFVFCLSASSLCFFALVWVVNVRVSIDVDHKALQSLQSQVISMTSGSCYQSETTEAPLSAQHTSRNEAEAFWKNGTGKIWLLHSRKAGGTTLCMTLRANQMGLIASNQTKTFFNTSDNMPQKRKTCQLLPFCVTCDLKKKYKQDHVKLQEGVRDAMRLYSTNLFESEGTGAPFDMLSSTWSDFVFISSIRNPLERIQSSLRNDPRYSRCWNIKDGPQKANCLHVHLASEDVIFDMCRNLGTFMHCNHNYYIRIFSGLDRNLNNASNQEMLELAKKNFDRFSCVLLVEAWDETVECLGRRLGLHRLLHSAYNVNNGMQTAQQTSQGSGVGSVSMKTNLSSLVLPDDYQRLVRINQVDMEFFEWAKARILAASQQKLKSGQIQQ